MLTDRKGEVPSGFVWQPLKEINGGVFKPDYWFFQALKGVAYSGPQPVTYHLSRENIFRSQLKTGLTVTSPMQLFPDKVNPDTLRIMADSVKSDLQDVEDIASPISKGFLSVDFKGLLVKPPRLQGFPQLEGGELHYRIQASLQTGTLYMVYFETPLKTSRIEREIRQKMMESLVLDPTI